MNICLLYKDHNLNLEDQLPRHGQFLLEDLELRLILNAMSKGDELTEKVARHVLLSSTVGIQIETITYRQKVLKDYMQHAALIDKLYDLAGEVLEDRRKDWLGIFSSHPSSILSDARRSLLLYFDYLEEMQMMAEQHYQSFSSEGFKQFFHQLNSKFNSSFLEQARQQLYEVEFNGGMSMDAQTSQGNKIGQVQLNNPPDKPSWWHKLFPPVKKAFRFQISPRDTSGTRFITELEDRAINDMTAYLGQIADNMVQFFTTLRAEIAFYKGCKNLHDRLSSTGREVCFPTPLPIESKNIEFEDLFDISLALQTSNEIVGNTLSAKSIKFLLITGANQGGKSTFLRSLGQAQIMMQAGMFVGSRHYSSAVFEGIFTHYKKEEDTGLKHGKFEEEIARMDVLLAQATHHSLFLLNESFAATNEREGSEIAYQVSKGLMTLNISLYYVSHLYSFNKRIWEEPHPDTMFLRAERKEDGSRSFKLKEAAPEKSSYAKDIYKKIFKT